MNVIVNEGCFVNVDVQYPEDLHNLHNDLPDFQYLSERMEIEKVGKFAR